MRFLMRAASGALIFAACLVILGFGARPYLACAPGVGAWVGADCALDEQTGGRRRGGGGERVYVVRAAKAELGVETPVIAAFGEVRSGRTLEIHALASGRLVEVSPAFREGGEVDAGAALFRIDPAAPGWRRAEASALLDEAKAELRTAESSVALKRREREAAIEQRRLRTGALERQRQLEGRGVVSAAAIEDAELAVADAERAVIAAEGGLEAEQKRVEAASLAIARAEIALADADRTLEDTEFRAPFHGILQEANAVLGRLVSANERLGALIDPSAIEVGFRVSDADFARLLDEKGALTPLPVTARLDLGVREVAVNGSVDRVASTVAPAEGGRLVFARLDLPRESVLRPGDFVTVEIAEAPLERVARLPASAVDNDGGVLVIGADERLEARNVKVLRRQGDTVLARGEIDGALVVLERTPQLGPGVKARAAEPAGAASVAAAEPKPETETIALDPERRDKLIAFVKKSGRMPEERRERLLAMLSEPEAPRAAIERLEARMVRRAGSN